MYLFPQSPSRRRASPQGLGAIRVARLPLTPQMIARGMGVRAGVVAPVSGYILSASLRVPSASHVASGLRLQKPYDSPGTQPGGVPFASAPRRQAGAFTQIGPGSASSPASAGFAPVVRGRRTTSVRRRRGLRGLAGISPDDAAKQVFPNAPASPNPGHNMATYNQILQAAQTGQMTPGFLPGTGVCAKAPGVGKAIITTTAGGLALKFAGATGPAAPLVAAFGGILELIGGIFSHHAAAQALERSEICSAVPAANNALQALDSALTTGQITPAQAMQGLQEIQNQFNGAVANIRKGNDPTAKGECNQACAMATQLAAIVLVKTGQYQDLQAQASANPVATAQSLGLPSNLPGWVLPAAAFGILWWVL